MRWLYNDCRSLPSRKAVVQARLKEVMSECSKCGVTVESGQQVCSTCATLGLASSPGTMHLRVDAATLRLRRARQDEARAQLPEWSVNLHSRGLSERLNFVEGTQVILGRTAVVGQQERYLDLDRYGGRQRGVSRRHAVLRFANGQVTLTDLNSLNGTSINLQKLEPQRPYLLRNGDQIMVGALSIVIYVNVKQPVPPCTSE
jgi:FHA domain